MGAIKEMNNIRWFWFAIAYQTILSYVVALCVFPDWNLYLDGTFGIGTVIAIVFIIAFLYLLLRPYKESDTLSINVKSSVKAKA